MPKDEAWHLDRRVPIAMILAFVIQTLVIIIAGVSWKSDVDHRLASLEKVNDTRSDHERRITMLEAAIPFIKESLVRIETRLGTQARKPDRM